MVAAPGRALAYDRRAGGFDEAIDDGGALRPAWARLVSALGSTSPAVLAGRQQRAERLLDAEGAGHRVHELALERSGGAPSAMSAFRLDTLPLPLGRAEFDALAAAAMQRMGVLERMLVDLFGPRTLVRDRVVPAQVLYGLRGYQPGSAVTTGRWLVTYALDVVRCADGAWRVVRDLTDVPTGLGAALLVRSVTGRLLPDALRLAGVAPIDTHFAALRRALLACAPKDRRSPRCVLLTPGPAFASYVEHSYLATQLGYHLVEGADLVMREGRLWLRALDGLEAVDVLFRRVDDEQLDPLESRASTGVGVPGVVWGAQRGGVGIANAPGSGIAQDPRITDLVDDAAARFGESLQLQRFDGRAALGSTPVVAGDGTSVAAGEVVVRLHLVAGPDGVSVMPGATARLTTTEPGDHGRTSVLKDVWVIDGRRESRRSTARSLAPQVDLFTSLPRRAADSLFWLGRAAERAEVAARTAREVRAQVTRDPALGSATTPWLDGALALLRAARVSPSASRAPVAAPSTALAEEIGSTTAAVAEQIANVVGEAMSVREFMSTTTGRVLGRLASVRARLGDGGADEDELDTILVDLAALAGLATESTVRGPAWRFLDIGRRLERALAVLGAIEAGLGVDVDSFTLQPLAETVLAANESLVTYRRRYRSDVVLDAVLDLLVGDETNPRGLAFQLDRLREHMAALAWADGLALIDRSSIGTLTPIDDVTASGRRLAVDALVVAVRAPLLELNGAIVHRWFADPVNPTMMSGR
ncbi:MAG: circularly permuted type 2 ATP-grasp protein [Ilumatobacteraceae bacterium]